MCRPHINIINHNNIIEKEKFGKPEDCMLRGAGDQLGSCRNRFPSSYTHICMADDSEENGDGTLAQTMALEHRVK